VLQDRARIFVQAGAGGNGVVSFRREAHVPKGGPDGGDGGRGADVVLVCDPSLRDLATFKRKAHWKALRGGHGEGSNRHGASPAALVIRVPPGTVVHDAERGASWDLTTPGQRATVARGGSGGHGNRRFTTATRQAPRFAERGLVGEEGWIELRLKLIADVGLVGLPNAGKSSLLGRMTRAQPKVADYPFTTLSPVLGTIEMNDRQLVIADIPGLIEGASEGAGLGHEFLAHIERTRLLVHVVELTPIDGSDPLANYEQVEAELRQHGAGLADLPRILCLSKSDLVPPEAASQAAGEWRRRLADGALDVVVTSSATGEGIEDLKGAIATSVPEERLEHVVLQEVLAEHKVYRPGADEGFSIEQTGEHAWRVGGRGIERLLARHDVDNDDAMRYVEDRLRSIGVIRALEAEGFEAGDDVEIAGVLFELDPGAPFG
jgi:GTP-binding protein